MFYYGIYLLFGCISITNHLKLKDKSKKFFQLWLPMIILILISGLRAQTVGADTTNYGMLYLNREWNDVFSDFNIVYNIYCMIIKTVSGANLIVFNFVNAFVILIPVFYFFEKYSEDYLLSVYIFLGMGFFFNSMNQHREYIAISILILMFDKMVEEHYLESILLAIIAILIHNIAIVFVVAIGVIKFIKKIDYISIGILLFLTFCVYYYYEDFVDLFIKIFKRYSIYLQEWVELYTSASSKISIIYSLILTTITIILVVFTLRINKLGKKYNKKEIRVQVYLTYFMAIASIINFLTAKILLLLRVVMLFNVYLTIVLPYIYKKFTKNPNLLKIISYLIMFVYMYILLQSDGSGVNPYLPFWHKVGY